MKAAKLKQNRTCDGRNKTKKFIDKYEWVKLIHKKILIESRRKTQLLTATWDIYWKKKFRNVETKRIRKDTRKDKQKMKGLLSSLQTGVKANENSKRDKQDNL